jgi:preprotein translocase subunit SecA
VLQTLDHLWREHLATLDHLRSVIFLRGYGQRDPLQEYRTESFELFQSMLSTLRQAVTAQMMRVELAEPEEPEAPDMDEMETNYDQMAAASQTNKRADKAERDPENPATWGKVGRNEICPCGTGKKFKHCHGQFV